MTTPPETISPLGYFYQQVGFEADLHRQEILDCPARFILVTWGYQSDILITSLPRPQVVERVGTGLGGVLEGIRRGSVYVGMSTCDLGLLCGLDPAFRQKGVHTVDAPMLSSPQDAVDTGVTVMVGGERIVLDRLQPMLEAFSDHVIYADGLGCGSPCKIIHNMVNITTQQVVAGALTLGLKTAVESRSCWTRVTGASSAPCGADWPTPFSRASSSRRSSPWTWRGRT